MANYFVINNKFRPYSFDELIKPYQIYGEEYKRQESILNELEAKASDLEAALSQTNDPESYAKYSAYLEGIKQTADQIATKGLNIDTRRRANQLAGSFHREIVPIQAAANRRRELADEQRKAMLSNPTLYYQRNFNDIANPEASIDRFVENPNYDYGNFFSGALLEKQVSDIASTLAKELTNYGPGKKLDRFTNTFIQQHGFTRDQVLNAINNPDSPDSSPVLKAIVDSVVTSSGVPQWGDDNALKVAYANARRGLFSAVGQTNVSPYDDYGAKLSAQLSQQKALADYKSRQGSITGIPINPLNIYNPNEISEIGRNIRKYSKFFDTRPDGTVVLNDDGRKAYKNDYKTARIGTAGGADIKLDSGFRDFMDSLIRDGSTNGHKMSIEDAWQKYLEDHDLERWDATKTTEYGYSITGSQQDDFKQAIITAANNNNLKEVEYDAKTHTWKNTGKEFTTGELEDKRYTTIGSRMSSAGTQIIVQDTKEGKTYRLTMPRGINPVNEYNRDSALKRADAIREAIVNKRYNNEAEYLRLLNDYNEALQSAYLYHSQLGLTYSTKPEEFNPYVF